MSSRYQILDNRSIDQWKVTELKEELKKRNLTTRGLKDDLVKRLDEAVRIERENAEEEEGNDFNSDPHLIDDGGTETAMPVIAQTVKDVVDLTGSGIEKETGAKVQVDVNESAAALVHEGVQGKDITIEEELVTQTTTVETEVTVTENVATEVTLIGQNLQSSGQNENVNTDVEVEYKDHKLQLESEGRKAEAEIDDPKGQLECVGSKPQLDVEDSKVQLENEVKPEMVEPSSCTVGEVKLEMENEVKPLENKAPVDERDDKNVANVDMSNKNDSAEMAYSEKLNLDRSSGDDSMEEDVLESKQIDSKCNADEMGENSEKNGAPIIKEKSPDGVVGDDLSADKKAIAFENKSRSFVPGEKRKFHDQEAVENDELSKRRKRDSDNMKAPELQDSNLMSTTTPKDTTQPALLRRNFSRSDSTASEDTHKERVVPPSQKAPTTSLRIDHFLRPFTLKAVQELLGKSGTISGFWMDQIKTHCYVTYSTVEEAIGTRNAVYNLQWPPNGGRLLVADFVDPQEVKTRLDGPPQTPTTPGTPGAVPQAQPASLPQPPPRLLVSRQQLPPPYALPPPPPLFNPPPVIERLPLPPPPPPPERLDPPIVTLDDLFWKTKATPRIYYLPLSDELIAAKQAARGRNIQQ